MSETPIVQKGLAALPEPVKGAVITVSDRCAAGTREDRSGPLAVRLLAEHDVIVRAARIVPDGTEPVREAMHAVFLYHAIQVGMDMGIVNAGQLAIYDELPPELRELCEDVVLNRRDDATDRLLEAAERFKSGGGVQAKTADLSWREAPVEKRIEHAPGERAMRASALQGEIDALGSGFAVWFGHGRLPLQSVVRAPSSRHRPEARCR